MVVPTKFMESLSDMVRDIDNWCHFLLTAVMVMLLCFDWQRKHKYQLLKMPGLALFWIIGFVLTAIFEILQIFIPDEYRRWFDFMDLLWQAVGGLVAALCYSFLQLAWVKVRLPAE